MSEPDDPPPTPNVTVRTLTGEEAQAALREALQSVAQAFTTPGGAGGGLMGSLQALGRLSDPHVRDQINAAFAHLQEAGAQAQQVQGSSTVIDLRGTEAGSALRGLVERIGAAGLASLPGVIVHEDEAEEPHVVAAQGQAPLVVSVAQTTPPPRDGMAQAAWTEAAGAPTVSEAAPARRPSQPAPAQPSLVEDAGGGMFGWLGRLLGGRR